MAHPRRRSSSPLDSINAIRWEPQWSIELTQLLAVLTQLIELEEPLQELLTHVLAGPLLTRTALRDLGTTWPSSDRRRPRLPITGPLFE